MSSQACGLGGGSCMNGEYVYYSDSEKLYPRCEATVDNHTMGSSLRQYLRIKVHQKVLERAYDGITIVGAYVRSNPSVIFQGEKRDKPFNWQMTDGLDRT